LADFVILISFVLLGVVYYNFGKLHDKPLQMYIQATRK